MNLKKVSGGMAMPIAAAVLSLAAQLALAQDTMLKAPGMAASGSAMAGYGSEALSQSMMGGMKQMQDMKPTGDTDKDFAMMMKMHHQKAVDMAQIELEHGKSPQMRSMARKIIAAQKKEISEFDQWIKMHP